MADLGAQRLLDEVGLDKQLCDPEFHEAAVQRVANALRTSLPSARRVTHVGVGQGIVHDVASNRRVVLADGHARILRVAAIAAAIDSCETPPTDLSIPGCGPSAFGMASSRFLALHSYATHPMSYYGRGEVSADFVGLARRMRQQDDPQVFQIYATGCAGDVTAGKYNDGAPENRPILAKRLHAAMQDAWRNTRRWPLETVQLRSVEMSLPFRGGEQFATAALRKTLDDSKLDERTRILAAMALASRQRIESGNKTFGVVPRFRAGIFGIAAGRVVCRISAHGPAAAAGRTRCLLWLWRVLDRLHPDASRLRRRIHGPMAMGRSRGRCGDENRVGKRVADAALADIEPCNN